MAYAAPSVVIRGCILDKVLAVSPLHEDLNSLARLGNLSFSQTDGYELTSSRSVDGSENYVITQVRGGIFFQLTLGPTEVQSGHFAAAPVSERLALLSFRKSMNSEIVKAAYLTCF